LTLLKSNSYKINFKLNYKYDLKPTSEIYEFKMSTLRSSEGPGQPSRNMAGQLQTTGGAMPNIETPADAKLNRMQLVQYSVRAQQHIL
jgi:hypothetical protein